MVDIMLDVMVGEPGRAGVNRFSPEQVGQLFTFLARQMARKKHIVVDTRMFDQVRNTLFRKKKFTFSIFNSAPMFCALSCTLRARTLLLVFFSVFFMKERIFRLILCFRTFWAPNMKITHSISRTFSFPRSFAGARVSHESGRPASGE
jgi:hypothetical protein